MPTEEPCWLVGTTPDGKSQIMEARLFGGPHDGFQAVRVGPGCGIIHSIPVEKVYRTREAAESRLREVEAEDG